MTQLSPHFTLEELTHSQTAARHGLDNKPTPSVLANLQILAETLEEIRAVVGGPIVVSSGYRAPAVNAAVGGSKTSAHCYGLAADLTRPGLTPKQFAEKIAASKIQFDQLILEFGSWVHVGLSAGKQRRQILTKDATHDYAPGLH